MERILIGIGFVFMAAVAGAQQPVDHGDGFPVADPLGVVHRRALEIRRDAGGADVGVNGNITLNGNASVNGTIYAPNTNVGVCKNKGPIPGITVSGTGPAP